MIHYKLSEMSEPNGRGQPLLQPPVRFVYPK